MILWGRLISLSSIFNLWRIEQKGNPGLYKCFLRESERIGLKPMLRVEVKAIVYKGFNSRLVF